ncbi:MAG: DUF3147 family protein [Pseudomonadota bacterium]
MAYLIFKFALSAALIVAVSELARRNSSAAALFASLPLVSVLAFVWLYLDTHDAEKIAALSGSVFWLVIPSLLLFLALPVLLRAGVSFWIALPVSCLLTAAGYLGMAVLLKRFGIAI